ncbi:PAAR domain-containing protein [Paraburkholderia sp. MPAMCS5]|uniref:PAAR domain-containing protein n=1 Tax=Paraburkholderia sp. MPAMCS5 TaxID=3112563 RepID=UPI002E17EFB2|nr:PAAR domain-containing protein [Paraburkholderia sp. MPAMCS5]
MAHQIIVTGDTLSLFGGEVIQGSDADSLDGRKVAGKGNRVNCVEHCVNSIVDGDDSTVVSGMPVALEGHHATCGCILVSRQQTMSVA